MPYILEARAMTEQVPRLAWLEATGKDDEVCLTFASSFGVIVQGYGGAEEMEAFATGGGDCVCSGDLWVERTDQPHLWIVTVVSAPQVGSFCVSAFDLTCGLQHVQLDRLLTNAAYARSAPVAQNRPSSNSVLTLQTARGSSYDA